MDEKQALKLKNLTEIIVSEIKEKIRNIESNIKLASIILGNNNSSLSYLKGMKKNAQKIGLDFEILEYSENITEEQFLKELEQLNQNNEYSGIIIQVPLPKQINFNKVAEKIDYKKDIDAISPYNQGRLFSGKPFLIPATAQAVDITLKFIETNYSYQLKGKNAVIMGRSLTVGKPAFHLLLQRNITPTIVHTKTEKTEEITKKADILVAACGIPELVKKNWIKENSIVIDVGIHYKEDNSAKGYKICGDVDTVSVLNSASIVTAVPGGIGSITSSLAFANCVKCWYKINKNEELHFNFEN